MSKVMPTRGSAITVASTPCVKSGWKGNGYVRWRAKPITVSYAAWTDLEKAGHAIGETSKPIVVRCSSPARPAMEGPWLKSLL